MIRIQTSQRVQVVESDFGPGLVSLVNKYSYSDLLPLNNLDGIGEEGGTVNEKNPPTDNSTIYTTRLIIETRDLYLGDVDNITLTSAELGMSGSVLATCQPPQNDPYGVFINSKCTITKEKAAGLKTTLAWLSNRLKASASLAPKKLCSTNWRIGDQL